jgi:hypothetical protein
VSRQDDTVLVFWDFVMLCLSPESSGMHYIDHFYGGAVH